MEVLPTCITPELYVQENNNAYTYLHTHYSVSFGLHAQHLTNKRVHT